MCAPSFLVCTRLTTCLRARVQLRAVVPKLGVATPKGVAKCFLGVVGLFEVAIIFEEILIYWKGG